MLSSRKVEDQHAATRAAPVFEVASDGFPSCSFSRDRAMTDAAWLDEGARLPPDPRPALGHVIRALRRRKWRFLLVCTPIFLAGLGYLLTVPERYTAHGTVMVGFRQPELLTPEERRDSIQREPDIDGAMTLMRAQPALRFVVNELHLLDRPEFRATMRPSKTLINHLRRSVASLLGRASPMPGNIAPYDPVDAAADELRKNLKIERVGRAALLDVSYTSLDPVLAAGVVNTLARFTSEDEGFLSRMTLAERADFQIVKTSVFVEAVPPEEPTFPSPILILGATGICALAAGFGAVMRKELRAQQTVLSIDEVTRRGLRCLGLIPEDHSVDRRSGAGVALVASDPAHVFCASVTSLQAAVSTLPRSRSEGGRVLLLTSALPAEGKSTTAAALATSMAASGNRVLLLDADLRSPTLHRSFDLAPGPGLAECVGSEASLEPAIRKDLTTGVHVLAAGDAHARTLGVLGSPRLQALLELWRMQFDAILIDSPPILVAGDARMLAQLCDDVIVVVRWGSTTWSALTHAVRALEESGAHLAGVAVSRVDVRQLSTYDYPDAQIYGAAYGDLHHDRRN